MASYKKIEEIEEIFDMTASELLENYDFKYSERTDKYDYSSAIQMRTMTIGLEKHLNNKAFQDNDKEKLFANMNAYSSLFRKIFKKIQHGHKFPESGKIRPHRDYLKKINEKFDTKLTNLNADSALADAKGLNEAMITHKLQYENRLKQKIFELEKSIKTLLKRKSKTKLTKEDKLIQVRLERKSKKKLTLSEKITYQYKKLYKLKSKLEKSESKNYKKIHFKGKYLKDKVQYKKMRKFLMIQGTSGHGNQHIGIKMDKSGQNYVLKIYKSEIPIKIPKNHQDVFSLDGINRQSTRISYDKDGKLMLNITYSYIKAPTKKKIRENSRGVVGIDIGPNGIDVNYVKKDGNSLLKRTYNISELHYCKTDDKKRRLSLILDRIINDALNQNFYQIAIENLDSLKFRPSKNKKLNYLLSNFPKAIFKELLISKSARNGLKLTQINPMYTSVIGLFKYAERDNLSTAHHGKSVDFSAALVIARRAMGFREKPVVQMRQNGRTKSIFIGDLDGFTEYNSAINTEYKRKLAKIDPYLNYWEFIRKKFKSVDELMAHLNVNFDENQNLDCLPF